MFVTFEGPEGAGKSTALLTVADALRQSGIEVITTREPGSGVLGKKLREILLEGEDLPYESELFLFLADRANHVQKVISPALALGQWVLCDRHADSTFVYQAVARGLEPAFVRAANRFATRGLVPDLTFLFDLDPEIGLARLKEKDRMDAQPLEFHRLVRQGFLDLAKEEPNRFRLIDAAAPPNLVVEAVLDHLPRPPGKALPG